jgi:hypothetical protein
MRGSRQYSVVQSVERHLWKWSALVEGAVITGQAATKSEAASEAERADSFRANVRK